MNPLFREAAQLAQHGWIMGATTLLFIGCFIGWTWWAYSSRNRERMLEAANLPFTEEDA